MIVCIAEKPSVAKDIARVIGATHQHDGYMEGGGYQVTWTFGHLCELKMPEDYTPLWKRWTLGSLPMIPPRFGIRLKEDQGVKKQFAVIEKLMQAADEIVNCGDAGQEGELIQRWVMQKAQAKCPVKRLWISSMTDEAIRDGFARLHDQNDYQSLYMAGLSRAIGDWLLGINATRLYSIKYGHPGQPLSIGRVQTPTLALIVNRQREIDNFKPEPYWVLATVYRDTVFTATKGRYTDKAEGERAFEIIAGRPFTVTDVQKKKGTEAPPHLYDLTSLQVDCNRKFGFSAEMTLNLIQSLYEKKFTTYPRVDTQFLSDDIYPKCPQTMNGLYKTQVSGRQPYADIVRAIGGKPLKKSKKVFDSSKVTDHHAIIPTGVPPQGLTDMEWKVFDLVARRFIAAFYPDCQFAQTTVLGTVGLRVEGLELRDVSLNNKISKVSPLDPTGRLPKQELSTLNSQLIRPMTFVPETMAASKMMQTFLSQKKSLGVVVDEFGGTSGLISLEDIVEEIFGDIEDEHDSTNYVAKQLDNGEYLLSARLEIEKVNELFDLELPESDEYMTIGGLILHEYQSFPKLNEVVKIGHLEFKIIKNTATKIELVRLKVGDKSNFS